MLVWLLDNPQLFKSSVWTYPVSIYIYKIPPKIGHFCIIFPRFEFTTLRTKQIPKNCVKWIFTYKMGCTMLVYVK